MKHNTLEKLACLVFNAFYKQIITKEKFYKLENDYSFYVYKRLTFCSAKKDDLILIVDYKIKPEVDPLINDVILICKNQLCIIDSSDILGLAIPVGKLNYFWKAFFKIKQTVELVEKKWKKQ